MKYYILIAAIIFAMASCSSGEKPVDLTGGNTKEKTIGYETGKVAERPLASYVRLPGQLRPFEEVNIYARANGFVEKVLVDRGSMVKKGQVLVIVNAPETEAQLQSANSRYMQAQQNANASRDRYNRLKEAAKEEGSVSQMELDNASSRMKADEALANAEIANVNSVQQLKNYLTIRAPFDGVIVDRNISAGALVGPGSKGNDKPMLLLQQLQKMRLEVAIPEGYADKVDLEHHVSFVFNATPGNEHIATISRSSKSLGSLRSEAVEIDVLNTDHKLMPGMYAEVRIPLQSKSTSLLVPNSAIVRSTERQYVLKVVNGKAEPADVKEGIATNDSTEVFGNLKGGDIILLHASDEIKQGTEIVGK